MIEAAARRRPAALEAHAFGAEDITCRRCGKRWIVIVTTRDVDCRPYRPGLLAAPRRLPSREDLVALRQGGMTLQEIGEQYGISRQAVDAALRFSHRAAATRRAVADSEYIDPKRPHLSWIRLACEPELRRALVDAATTENVSLSEIVRRACRRYVGPEEGHRRYG